MAYFLPHHNLVVDHLLLWIASNCESLQNYLFGLLLIQSMQHRVGIVDPIAENEI
jgi:hypothetical protein